MLDFRGLCAATFTPMLDNGDVNVHLIPEYAAFLADNQVQGVFVNGTTGEGCYSLTVQERLSLAEAWMQQRPLIPTIIIHVAGCNLKDALTLAEHAERIGASGIGILAPCFVKPRSVADLVEWIAAIAAAAPNTPCMYYHLPAMTNVCLPVDEVIMMAADRVPTFIGVKFSSMDLFEARRCSSLKRPQDGKPFLILFGSDEAFLGHYTCGLSAAIGSSYNMAPKLYQDLMKAVDRGDVVESRRLHHQITSFFSVVLQSASSGTAALKCAMKLMTGLDVGPPRLPLIRLSEQQERKMQEQIRALQLDYAVRGPLLSSS